MIVYRHENNHGKQWAYKLGWILFGWAYDIRYDRCRWFLRLFTLILCTASLAFGDELLRPSVDATSTATIGCTGTNVVFTSFPNARDAAGLATSSNGSVTGGPCGHFVGGNCTVAGKNHFSTRVFSGWSAAGTTWNSLTINVNWSTLGGSFPTDTACVAYSINSGMTWTTLLCSPTARAQATSSASLATSQDLTKLRVGICVMGQGADLGDGFPGNDDITVWDIWTLGTNNAPIPPPAGSGTSRPTDPVIISRWWQQLLESV